MELLLRNRTFWVVAALILSASQTLAGAPATDLRIGLRVNNFTLPATDGSSISLYSLAGKKAAVLVFTGTQCPVGNLYLPRLVEVARSFEPKGVAFLAINSNASESMGDVTTHAQEHGLNFPMLKDAGNVVADQLGVRRTCEVLVLDAKARVRYRGAIDDQYVQGARKPEPTKNYLADALNSVLAGEQAPVVSTEVAGCPIERVESKTDVHEPARVARVRAAAPEILAALAEADSSKIAKQVGKVTFAGNIAAILQEKCQKCHRPGQVGPFSLLTYDDARRWATSIAEVVESHRMPPWHADPRYGHFSNDRSLTSDQRAALLAWVDQGSPLGDPATVPAARTFPEGWSIGTPDLVVAIPKALEIPAEGVLDYIDVEVPTGFETDRWVQAAEILPTERSVVHHVIVFVKWKDERGRNRKDHLAAYVPGDIPTHYPPGMAKKIPAGSTLSFQIHYTPTGTPHVDQTQIGLIFAQKPVEHEAHTWHIINTRFRIPPGEDNYEVRSTWTVPKPIHLLSLAPHMHLRGKDFRYTATFPDGRTEVLLSVPAYDFGWQSVYVLDQPMALPSGTKIDCLAHFDNSTQNPSNPDPSKEVRWGEQSFQEMMMGYLDYSDDTPATTPP